MTMSWILVCDSGAGSGGDGRNGGGDGDVVLACWS